MRHPRFLNIAGALGIAALLMTPVGSLAQDEEPEIAGPEDWHAYSYSAEQITGDIILAPGTIEMGNAGVLTITGVEGYTPNLFSFSGATSLNLPEGKYFCEKGVDKGFMVIDRSQPDFLVIDVFGGDVPPVAGKGVDQQAGFCGSFTYNKS
ncbi:hypothetical protein PSE_0577 [Pseudovibrio sp. FO-BEG1]|uniref:Uncharacterized protein n=1 Tax=Pseudovibrio denitrificans TaxID=258256 RepID=A0A1I7B1V4_9HYPH|nr:MULTISPECIES: hypothetical protein [Pseudovibrio]AEV35089.1 hypothetical protein PSE_0577 [Pseudovibrio sp. FO-BEG1]SFT81167.1 hypothetical protein SAMN05444141_103553 [Pseudovibrio denitrificans]